MNNKISLPNILNETVEDFNALVSGLDELAFESNVNGKWSAGQDLVHLIKLLKILNIGYSIPKPFLRLLYGKNKNEARSYEQLQMMYKKALAGGAKSPAIYIPRPVLFKDKEKLIKKHQTLNQKFINKINKHSDYQLDDYCLPHPIIGKISLRELVYFTSFHTKHHTELLKNKLGK